MHKLDSRTGSLLRIVRLSKEMELSPETLGLVEQVLFDSLGLISTTTKTKKHEETIRRFIEEGASWDKIKSVLIDWWRVAPSPILAGKIIELTYLNVGHGEMTEILATVSKKSDGFWKEVHPAVRTQVVCEISNDSGFRGVLSYLAQHSLEYWLLPVERLVAFSTLYKSKMQTEAFELFSKFEKTLEDACITHGMKVSIPKGWLYLNAAKSAIDCGYKSDAVRILKKILPDDRFYQPAMKLSLALEADEKNFLKSEIASHLFSLETWGEREEALRIYLGRVRQGGNGDHTLIPILNTIFAKSAAITVQDPTTLSKYVKLCLEFADLVDLIPNVLAPLKHNIMNFHSRAIDGAIWSNVLLPQFDKLGNNWRAVGLLHRFVVGGSAYESNLFKSYEIFDAKSETKGFPAGLDFEILKKAAISHLLNSRHRDASEVELMVSQLQLAAPDSKIKIRYCESYLSKVKSPSYKTLERLLKIAKMKESPSLIQSVISCFLKYAYLRNSDLKTLWHISTSYRQYDLAWRVATILESRRALPAKIHYPWTVSGEKRSIYPVVHICRDDAAIAAKGFENSVARACMALTIVGYKIPDLLVALDSKLSFVKITIPPANSIEEDLLEAIKKIDWLTFPEKRVGKVINKHMGASLPPFVKSLPSNRWVALLSMMSEVTGFTAISGDMTKLQRIVETVSSSIGTKAGTKFLKNSASKWLKTLTPSERTAWAEMNQILRRVDPVKLELAIGKFLVRLSTLISPSHYEALNSLQSINTSLSYLRDLENFIIDEDYTNFRASKRLSSKVPVPDELASI